MSSESEISVLKTVGDYEIHIYKRDDIPPAWSQWFVFNSDTSLLFLPFCLLYGLIWHLVEREPINRGCGVVIRLIIPWSKYHVQNEIKIRNYKFTNNTQKDQKAVKKIIEAFTLEAEKLTREDEERHLKREADAEKELEKKRECCGKYKAVMEGVVGDEKKA